MKIGVVVESMGLPLRQALAHAARLGVGGVQFDAVGELAPDRLSETGRREIRNLLRSYNLQLTALNCPLRRGIDTPENQEGRLEHVRKVMSLSFDLGPRIAIVQCPRIPEASDELRTMLVREALASLGLHGDRTGATLALEIGLDPADKVRDYLNTFDVGCLAVNFDPANLLLHGHDPIHSVAPLAGKITHVQARDARTATVSRVAAEVPVGAGDIEWLGLVAALTAVDYRGWIVVKRETGENRLADVEAGVKFLRRVILPQ
jgi:sugar phosphate isomerase/epimerase